MNLINLFQSPNQTSKYEIPYIIAEAGVNHEGNMELAKRLIHEAKEGGAHAIKFQTYKASLIASKNSPSYWDLEKEPTNSQFELFKKYDKFWKKEFEILKNICDDYNIEFLSTPFDFESATFLNDLMNVFKISSSDLNNKPFIDYICNFNKPIILSTGASELWEIFETVSWIKKSHNPLSLLHCVLNYPTKEKDANLGMITGLKNAFPNYIIGYSDHTLPNNMHTCEVANLLGAKIIEKHFTFDKSLPGNDHYHAMDKNDLKNFIEIITRNKELIGSHDVIALPEEKLAIKNARRSIVAKNIIHKGKTIEYDDLTFKRPGNGISPKYLNEIIGLKAINEIKEDEIIKWTHLY